MILAMNEVRETIRPEMEGYEHASLSDEDLERVLLEHAKVAIVQCPELAMVVAEKLGWTVIPPGEC